MPVSYGEAVAWPPRRRVARFGSSLFGGGTAAMVVFERQIHLSAARSASDAARVRRLTDHAGHESAGLLRRSWLADAPRAGRFRRFDDRHQHCFQEQNASRGRRDCRERHGTTRRPPREEIAGPQMEPIKGAFVLTNRTRSQGVSDLRDAAGTDEAVTRG